MKMNCFFSALILHGSFEVYEEKGRKIVENPTVRMTATCFFIE